MIRIWHFETTILTNSHNSLENIWSTNSKKHNSTAWHQKKTTDFWEIWSDKIQLSWRMGANHFLWNLQKFNTGKSTLFRGALTSCLIQAGRSREFTKMFYRPISPIRRQSRRVLWGRGAEAPTLFDDALSHRAAHFEASQLKFKRSDGEREEGWRGGGGGVESNTATCLSLEFPPLRCWNLL